MVRLQQHRHSQQQLQKKKTNISRKLHRKEEREKRKGPRLPSSLRRELDLQNPHEDGEDEENEEEEENAEGQSLRPALPSDMYEYEENQAPEDSRKNRRFDDVDRLEYELPSDFEDEEIDEGAADGEDPGGHKKGPKRKKQLAFGKKKQMRRLQSDEEVDSDDEEVSSESDDLETHKHDMHGESNEDEDIENHSGNEDEQSQEEGEDALGEHEDSDIEADDDDDGDVRHRKMIEDVRISRTKETREKRRKHVELLSEAYPESEFNINPSTYANNTQQLTVDDLMTPLQTTTGFGSLRKRMQQLEKKGVVVDAPLPKVVQDRLSRKAGYEKANEEISKWQEIVKKNREAASLVFTQRPDLTAVSTAELVSKFEPTTDLEKEVASLLLENGLAEETSEAGTGLGFNKLTMSEVKERQERLAKMRNLLSYHETKAKRMKKIKSKTFHRLLQKDRKGKAGIEDELDPEALKEAAIKAEFKRAQERMTLKHKNTSKWAKRIIQRGLKAKEDGSREALAEQLRTHTALTKKIHAVDDASSSDGSSDEMGTDSGAEDTNNGLSLSAKPRAKLLAKAKVETLKVLEGDAEAAIPTSGLFSLPFMARAIEKKRKQAQNEAIAVLEQLEQLEYNVDGNGDFGLEEEDEAAAVISTGRLGFGEMARPISNGKDQEPDMLIEEGSSSDEDRVTPTAKKAPLTSKKRKADSNGNIDKICNGVLAQGNKLRVTEEAWISGGADENKAFGCAVSQAQKLQVAKDAGISVEVSGSGGSKAGVANPWLYGAVNKNENTAVERVGAHTKLAFEENSGPLVTSASFEVVNIAGHKRKVDKKVKAVQDDRILETAPTPRKEAEEMRSLSSSDSEEDENKDVGELGFQLSTENASQAELIQRAFAGDDVEADFEQLKDQALSEEVPMGEAAMNLPGWGQWTNVQKKKGPPLWMVKQQEELKRSRDEALRKRKDSKLKHVIISERMDKKAEKFLAPALPFPFKSRDIFEKSIRMPLGREFNTDQAFRDMIRPAVIKDAGVIIDPIKYKMSEAEVGETRSVPEEKRKGEKRANGPRLKRKS